MIPITGVLVPNGQLTLVRTLQPCGWGGMLCTPIFSGWGMISLLGAALCE
jgi:hypothetical protein